MGNSAKLLKADNNQILYKGLNINHRKPTRFYRNTGMKTVTNQMKKADSPLLSKLTSHFTQNVLKISPNNSQGTRNQN